jgi:thiamine kinase-like enzyme
MPLPDQVISLPCWVGPVRGTPLSGGLSNEIWKVTDNRGDHVVRLGRDYPFHHVFRSRELMTTEAAHAAGFAPAVEYAEPGVMVTRFVTSRTLRSDDVCQDPARIAALVRDFHHKMPAEVSGPAYLFWVFHVIRDYARTLQGAAGPHDWDLARYLGLAQALETTQVPLPLVFGHNDLLPANFLDDGSRLWLIDFEYAGFSTCMFDLAGVASNAGMSDQQAAELLRAYFGHPVDQALLRAFDAMQCASLLREAMWAMVSAIHLSAPGVDYPQYARDNLERLDASLHHYQSKHGRLPS